MLGIIHRLRGSASTFGERRQAVEIADFSNAWLDPGLRVVPRASNDEVTAMRMRFNQMMPVLACLATACGGRSNVGDLVVTSSVGGESDPVGHGGSHGGASSMGGSLASPGGTVATGGTAIGRGGVNATGGASNAKAGASSTGGVSTGKGGRSATGGASLGQAGANATAGTLYGSGGASQSGGTSNGLGGISGWGGSAAGNGGVIAAGGVAGTAVSDGGTAGSAGSSFCEAERVWCGAGATAKCVDTLTDPQHCGRCGSACGIGVVCASGACVPPRCAPTIKLGGLPSSETDASAVALAVGDLNGDGYLDAATANSSANTISVLLGNGKGVLGRRMDYPTGHQPIFIAIRDLNRDNKLDLITANNFDDSVSVLLGKGDGTFDVEVRYSAGLGPESLALGDFNDDGIEDIAAANYEADTVSVLLGVGNGTFATRVSYATGTHPTAIVAGDLNQDGATDLATINGGANTVSVLLGAGDGRFSNTLDTPTVAGRLVSELTLGDLNDDGIGDLVVSGLSSRYVSGAFGVLFGVGDGTFMPFAELPSRFSHANAVADLDGDGRSEIIAGYGGLSVLSVADDGTVAAEVAYPTPASPSQVAVGDFNGDQWLDIATVDSWGVYVLLAVGNGKFDSLALQPAAANLNAVLLRDLNGDGRTDLAATVYDAGTVRVLLGLGNGTFGSSKEYPTGYGQGLIEAGDFNGDGNPDLVTASNTEYGVSVLWNAGDGTYKSRTDQPTASGTDFLALADLDNNGRMDIVAASGDDLQSSAVTVLLNEGNGTFVSKIYYDAVPLAKLGLVDLNHDGKADLVETNGKLDGLTARFGMGDGSFGAALKSNTNQGGISAYNAAFGDLNDDGNLDFVARGSGTGNLYVMLGVGDGTFAASAAHDTSLFELRNLALVDLNGDGILDLIGSHMVSWVGGVMVVMLGAGDGTFTCSTGSLADAPDDNSFALGDVNGDKRIDIVFPNRDSKSIRVLLNQPL